MYEYIKQIENNLSKEDREFLKSVYAPRVVAVPPSDACRSMCVTPDGEIRIYGALDKKEPTDVGKPVYIASRDGGLTWKTHFTEEGTLGPATRNPRTGRCISVYPSEFRPEWKKSIGLPGTWAVLNDEGFDDKNNRTVKLTDRLVHVLKLPYYLESCSRWLIVGEYTYPDHRKEIVTFYSDDDGESWQEIAMPKAAPLFEVKPPHKGTRWQQYSVEPTVVELSSGELVMFVRTSQDYYYRYRSQDHGTSWEGPTQTDFHGTITMPVLQKLSDGRIVFFFCNTQPMPELDLNTVFPPLGADEVNGIWEDVFTNRDANHLAITADDMRTWQGFRELFLNELRNDADFRSVGGRNSNDKSVHQAQMLELPYNKLLVHFGQNVSARKVVILDLAWLYEQEREEDFRLGLGNLSTQMYLKSNLGGFHGFSGHCAYNRTNGALLVPDPAGNFEEVLQICRVEDERLVYQKQGAVWNFPASPQGRVEVRLSVLGSGVRLSLSDHWFNPADETVAEGAHVSLPITHSEGWMTVVLSYDTQAGTVFVTAGEQRYELPLQQTAPNGLSYLHIQTLAEEEDPKGTLIKLLKKSV
ncbi:MAG: exo-alpha-sialidase [Clostridia bacterium]|nr:exo-alpha-sialidase [Clostridia bacterium]